MASTQLGDLPPIVDTHAHLDDTAFDADRGAVMDAARAAGVRQFVNIGYKPERWQSSAALRDENPDVEIVLGLHPQEASRFDAILEQALRRAVRELRPIAIGETGFDFARAVPALSDQLHAFRAQLELTAETGLPVVIHQRNAADALMDELDRWPDLAPIVLHSFEGNERFTRWAIERGCFIGIGGLACKPASGPLRDLLRSVPPERLLLETDAPYLPPPGTKDRRNTPANLPRIAALLAPLWDFSAAALCRRTSTNALGVFGFDEDDRSQD